MIKSKLLYKADILNMLELFGVILVLCLAFLFQIVLHELPCPLCLLQRVGFLGAAFGFLLNLRFGERPGHYSIVLLSALFASFVALRQIALHVIPGSGVYGSAIFGLHFYTWSFIVSLGIVLTTSLILGSREQYKSADTKNVRWPYITHLLFAIVIVLTTGNIVSTYLECGFKQCPDNPTQYQH